VSKRLRILATFFIKNGAFHQNALAADMSKLGAKPHSTLKLNGEE
jgi:hypothetical protein